MSCPFNQSGSAWTKIKNWFANQDRSESSMSIANLQAILDTTVDSIITINEQCIIEAFNKTAEKMFGYSKEEVIGKNVKMLMPDPFHSEHDSYVHNYLTTGKKKIIGIGREVIARRKDNTTFPIDLAVSEVLVGNHRLFTGIIRDISSRKEAEMIQETNLRIEADMRAKNEFITMISHELRTPLHSIMGFTECLLNEMDGPLNQAQKESLTHSYEASQHLLQLINGVLELSKIASRQIDMRSESCDVVEILESCLQTVTPLANQKNLQLERNLPFTPCIVEANVKHLREIFLNLLSNAIKFTEVGKVVSTVIPDRQQIIIVISDTGVGIDEQDLQRIFIPFASSFHTVDTGKQKEHAGLGLALTKQLTELYGGTIEVSSKKGKGTHFTIRLPAMSNKKTMMTGIYVS